MFDIESEISVEGNLSDFEFEVIKTRIPASTNAVSVMEGHEVQKNISKLKKAKIEKLKQRLHDMQKAQKFIEHKLNYFVEHFENKIANLTQANSLLKTELHIITEQNEEYQQDLATITKYLQQPKKVNSVHNIHRSGAKSPQINNLKSESEHSPLCFPKEKHLYRKQVMFSDHHKKASSGSLSSRREKSKVLCQSGGNLQKTKTRGQKLKPFVF